jgi:hypothetical protein
MKIKNLPLITVIILLVGLTSFVALNPTGAPPAKTGSPGDGSNCTECHGGSPTNIAGWITSNIPGSGYVAGQTYQITATNSLTNAGKMGFEVSPQNAAGTLLGTLTPGTGTKLVGSGKYVTHSNANTTTNTWTFNWTAPTAGTGTVTFYGAFARGKPGPVNLSTLVVQEATVALPGAAGPISGPSAVCKNNSFTYSVGTIAGATSYVWTAPAGATIASGQGTTSISVNYGPSAVSGNVSVYGSNTAGNGTPSNLAVTVSASPSQPSAIAGVTTPCEGSTQIYSVVNTSGISYTWVAPAGSTITAGQGTNSITVSVGSTSGSLSVVPSNSCGNGTGVNATLTVQSIPGVASAPTGPDIVDLRNTLTSSYSTTGTAGASAYNWEISPANAGTIDGSSMMATVTWNGSFLGNASIRVKAVNDCGEGNWSVVKQTNVINTTGIQEVSKASSIQIYPNPSNGHFTVELNGEKETAILKLLDATGKEVYKEEVNNKGINTFKLNLRTGVYFLIVTEGSKSLTQKLFIQ